MANTSMTILILSYFSALLLLFAALCYLYYFHKRNKALQQKEEHAYRTSQEIIAHTHAKVQAMLEKTTEKAERMLLQTEYVNHNVKKDMDRALSDVVQMNKQVLATNAEAFFNAYKEELQEVKREYFSHVEQSIEEIKDMTEAEIRDFISIIIKETVEAQGIVGKKINDEFVKAQEEIKTYKQEQIKKVDASIDRMIVKIAEDVVGKTISLANHQALVLKALEEAKKEGLFDR